MTENSSERHMTEDSSEWHVTEYSSEWHMTEYGSEWHMTEGGSEWHMTEDGSEWHVTEEVGHRLSIVCASDCFSQHHRHVNALKRNMKSDVRYTSVLATSCVDSLCKTWGPFH